MNTSNFVIPVKEGIQEVAFGVFFNRLLGIVSALLRYNLTMLQRISVGDMRL